MASAVIFDFYGTLARWRVSHLSNYTTVFAAYGYELPDDVLNAYFARYDGIDHVEHSASEEVYEAWVRQRLCDLTDACGVSAGDHASVMDALRESDRGDMVAYPDALATLSVLREAGVTIGVCSNWGWHLDPYLRQVGLLQLVDASVTSARVGVRKPHPTIYSHTAQALHVLPDQVVFIGDSWMPDVEGPRRMGMAAVHLWRPDERNGQEAPELSVGVRRIGSLVDLPPLLNSL